MEDEIRELKVSKDTQRFVKDLSDLPNEKYHKVVSMLNALGHQQESEAHMENARGWRYMWQRTPKVYLLMLGYFVFFGSVGSFGYSQLSHATNQTIFLSFLAGIMGVPLIIVFYLGYNYVKHFKDKEKEDD